MSNEENDPILEQMVSKSLAAASGHAGVLSSGEYLAAALVLNQPEWLTSRGYTIAEAIARIGVEWSERLPEAERQVKELMEARGMSVR